VTFRLTDSLLGYAIVAFLGVVALHLLIGLLAPDLGPQPLGAIDVGAFAIAIGVEQLTIALAGRRLTRPSAPG
jgi:hypothetical protein